MSKSKTKKQTKKASVTTTNTTIAVNRKAKHEYIIETRLEAGIVLEGWEVKSLRAGKAQIADSYVILKNGEAWLLNTIISPLISTSTHKVINDSRTRKLLLHKKELHTLLGQIEKRGYTLIPLNLYWKKNKVKIEIALAKGKKLYDKRQSDKERDWQLQKQRLLKAKS